MLRMCRSNGPLDRRDWDMGAMGRFGVVSFEVERMREMRR